MRTRVIRTLLLPAVVAVLFLAGCSDEPGTPTTTNTGQPSTPASQPSTPAQGSSLAGVEACQLLTVEDVKSFNVTEPGEDQGKIAGSDTSSCMWQRPTTSEKGGVTFSVAVRPAQGVNSVTVEEGWTKEGGSFEGREAVIIQEQRETAASCMIALAVGTNARVDVSANGAGTTKEICDVVNKVATIVEPKLPKDGG